MTADPRRLVTAEEYLAMEDASDTRHEFVEGRVVAMSGNVLQHVIAVGNLLMELNGQLLGKACRMLSNEMRVKVELTGDYFYPDLVGYCGTPEFETKSQVTLLNPSLIVEMLSRSTEAYDRGEKFLKYQQIASLMEYALISRTEVRVELFTRGENGEWVYSTVAGLDATVSFASIGSSVALRDIYRDVELDPKDPPPTEGKD